MRLDDCQRYCIVAGKRALEDAVLGRHERFEVCNLFVFFMLLNIRFNGLHYFVMM